MADQVAYEWASYQAEVVPAGAPPIQHQECRRAFYAGAWAILTMLPLSDAARELLVRECEEFKRRVQAGGA